MGERIEGRPDFRDHRFGVTTLKRFPPFVYSLLGGMLVHRAASVDAHWYKPYRGYLERLDSPQLTIRTVCGQQFYAGARFVAIPRARTCDLPKPGAVECGRCNGTGPVFGRGLAEISVMRREAKQRIGCVVSADDGAER